MPAVSLHRGSDVKDSLQFVSGFKLMQKSWSIINSELNLYFHQRKHYRLVLGLRSVRIPAGTPAIMIKNLRYISRPPLWSCGQSSWLQIQRSGFYSWRYKIFWQVVGLERGPLSLVSTTEVLLERKNSGSGLESREYGLRNSSRWPRGTIYPQKLALTSLTSGGRSIGIVRSRTQATEFGFNFRYISL
jgi:hypothetical protein